GISAVNITSGVVSEPRVTSANLDIPLIFVRFPAGQMFVDGHHRLEAARRRAVDTVPAVIVKDSGAERGFIDPRSHETGIRVLFNPRTD
ncbi:MAG: hypothetical protein ACREB9_09255, partial [Thermoplasmata archaeon]